MIVKGGANRVLDTQTFPNTLWNYCPTGDNPADLLTGGTITATLSTPLWTNGPSWLSDQSGWPQWNSALTLHLQTDNMETDQPVPIDPAGPATGIHKIVDLSKYSTLTKLLHVTCYVLRFITNLRNSTAKQTGNFLYLVGNKLLELFLTINPMKYNLAV